MVIQDFDKSDILKALSTFPDPKAIDEEEARKAFQRLLNQPTLPNSQPVNEAVPQASNTMNRLTELAKQSTLLTDPELQKKLVPIEPRQKGRTFTPEVYEALDIFNQADKPIAQMQNAAISSLLDTLNADRSRPRTDSADFLDIQAPSSDVLQNALKQLRAQKEGIDAKYADTEKKGREELKSVYEQLRQPETMGMPEMFARIALALGPALLGQALGQATGIGSAGGAAGGAAGMEGLTKLDTSIKDERTRQKEALLKYYASLSDQEKEKLKRLASQSDNLQKQLGELFMLQPKMELEMQKDIAKALTEAEAKKFVEKGGLGKNQDTMKMLLEFIKDSAKQGNDRAKTLLEFFRPIIEKQVGENEKPRPFALGFGIVPRPDVAQKDITPQMTGKAQEIASDYGSLKASVDRLGQLAKRGVIKGMVPLTQERDDVKAAVTDLFTKLKNNYVKAGAALSPGEEALVKQLGVDPSKDIGEMIRMATIPDNFLKLVQRTSNMIVNDASNKLYPYGYKMGGTKAEPPKPLITGSGKPEIPAEIQKGLKSKDMNTRIEAKKQYLKYLQKK